MVIACNLQHLGPDIMGALGEDLVDRTPDHHLDQLAFLHLGDQALAHELAVAEDRVAVGDAEDLIELVRDEEDGLVLPLQLIDEVVKLLDFLVGQGGGGFVHDDDAGVDRKRAGDGDKVLVGDAKIAKPHVGIDLRTDAMQDLPRLIDHPLGVDQAEASARGMAEEDVLGHRKLIEKHGFLMDRGDPCGSRVLRGGKADGCAIDPDRAAIGLVDTGQDLHHRRLAGAVFADKCRDLTGIKPKRDLRQRLHARKGLGHAIERKNGNVRGIRLSGEGLHLHGSVSASENPGAGERQRRGRSSAIRRST